ncbi:longitudinals lacking protein-like [Nilaparvata lugens]|uniref:longitudinals lacking protein-like n=1 Tax=Nilaparvata lugens TaxID=108931 RepID=UPI000B989B64|nr:longitudinals lacking protein-like [Nilaparvata lugens]
MLIPSTFVIIRLIMFIIVRGKFDSRHKPATLEPEQLHRCDLCSRTYKYRENLRRHKRQECGVAPRFSCNFCPYKAKQKSSLQSHVINMHSMLLHDSDSSAFLLQQDQFIIR